MAHELVLSLGTNKPEHHCTHQVRVYVSRTVSRRGASSFHKEKWWKVSGLCTFGYALFSQTFTFAQVTQVLFQCLFLSRSTVWHTPNSKHWEFQHQVMKIYVIFMRQTLVSFVKSSFELTFPKASQDAQLQENNFESKRRKDLFRLHLLAQSFLTSDSTAVHCVRKLRRSSFVSAFKNSTCP